jgi:hypothetical protein
MDAHTLAKLAAQLHNRIGRHAYMVGIKTTDKTPKLVVYVLKGRRVPAKAIPSSYQGVAVEVAKLERVRPAC